MRINKSALTMLLIGTLIGTSFTALCCSVPVSDAETSYSFDVNGDGSINIMDLNCLKTHLLEISSITTPTESPAVTTPVPTPTASPDDNPVSPDWKPNKTPEFIFPDENDEPETVIDSISKVFNELGIPTDDGLEISINNLQKGERYSTLAVYVQNSKWNNESMISGVDVSAYYEDRYSKLADAFNCKIPYDASGFASMGFEVTFVIENNKIIFMLPMYISGITISEKSRVVNETYLPYYEKIEKDFFDMSFLHYIVYKESSRPYLISENDKNIELVMIPNVIYGVTTDISDKDGNVTKPYEICLPDGDEITASKPIRITIDKESGNISYESIPQEIGKNINQNKQELRNILNENMAESACVTVKDTSRSFKYYQLHDMISKNVIYNLDAPEYSFIDISISADSAMSKSIINKLETLAGQTLSDNKTYYYGDYVVAMCNGKVVACTQSLRNINQEYYNRFRNANPVIAKAIQDVFGKLAAGHMAFLNSITSYDYDVTYDSKSKAQYKMKTEKLSDDLVRVSMSVSPIQNLNYNVNSETGAKEYISEYTDGQPIKNCLTHFVVNIKTGKVENIVLTN